MHQRCAGSSETVAPLLKRLEAAGLVRRERRPEDERSVNVVLTAAGEALRSRAVDVRSVVACAAGLPAEDFAVLRAALAEVTSTLAAADSPADAA